MKLTTIGRRYVDEPDHGVYVWLMPDGKWVGDDEGNWLSIDSMRGDKSAMESLKRAVRDFGVEVGGALFVPGHRKVTDEEFEEQRQRLLFGLTPDPLDIGAIKDDIKNARRSK